MLYNMKQTEKEPINENITTPSKSTKLDTLTRECTDSLPDINLDQIKISAISGTKEKHPNDEQNIIEKQDQEIENFSNLKTNTNNHHVVPIGVLIVLMTIYLGMTHLQKCFVNCIENPQNTEILSKKENIINYLQKPDNLQRSQIVERLLEYKDICKDLEIFTKDLNIEHQQDLHQNHYSPEEDELIKSIEVNSGSGNGNCAKLTLTKLKKSKYSIKTTNAKNGFNKYNKSVKAKFLKTQKKELNLNKKSSTAEPIIYLFALVFIYLLLKAASDINQHYKSQNKNDKRLRRCSLQSYAQIHRPDRRASKDLILKHKQQQLRLRSLSRSISQDHHNHHQYLVDGSPQRTEQLPTIKQHVAQSSSSSSPVRTQTSAANNWQLIRQHTTHSLDNSDITTSTRGNKEFPSMMTRRCSVPVALHYQRLKITSASPLGTVNDNVNVCLSRRTSITSSSMQLSLDPIDSLIPEAKRRVRMINRH